MDVGGSARTLSGEPGLETLLDHYDAWRRRWALLTGRDSSRNAPDLSDGQLWFRDGFPHPDWTARIIQSSNVGFAVCRATTERTTSPRISADAVFSHFEDAGKFLIAHFGDMLRRECNLEPRLREWRRSGLSDELCKSDSDQSVVDFIADFNDIGQGDIQRLVHQYSVKAEPDRRAYLASSEEPRSRVLTLTYNQLDAVLADGLVAST